MELGRGGACVPARVAPQGRIRRSSPAHNACVFIMETPLRERSGGHTGTAPTISFGWITRKWIMEFGRSGYRCTHLFRPAKGAFVVHPPHTMRVFLAWKRRCANVRAGTQAPPLRFRLDVARGCCPYHFKYNFLCVTVLTEDKKISKHTCISLRDCYIIAHRNNWYD